MNSKLRKPVVKTILLYLAVTLAFAIVYNAVGFYYEANDDTSMMRIAAGGFNGKPDGHLLFIRYSLGIIIAKLFVMNPNIDWYGATMIFILFVCVCLVLGRVLEVTSDTKKLVWIRTFSVLFFLGILSLDIIFFQFTTVAGIVAATALFLVATDNKHEKKLSRGILYIVLLTLVYMVRLKALYMIVPFITFIIGIDMLMIIVKGKNSIREHKKRILYYVCIVSFTFLAVCTVKINNTNAYASDEWSECKDYIHYRSKIVDYSSFPEYDSHKELWDSLNISREKHAILKNTFGIMPDINADDLEKISLLIDKKSLSLQDMSKLMVEKIREGGYWHYKFCLVIIITMAFCFCIKKNIPMGEKLKIIGLILISLAELFYLFMNGRVPDRVIFIWILATVAGIGGVSLNLFVRYGCNESEKLPVGRWILVFAGLLISVSCAVAVKDKVKDYRSALLVYDEYMEYLESNEENIYVANTGAVNSRKQFEIYRDGNNKSNSMGTRGWSLGLPMFKEWKTKKELDINMFPLCLEGVYYLTADVGYLDLMDEYMKSIGWTGGYCVIDEFSLPNGKMITVVSWNE